MEQTNKYHDFKKNGYKKGKPTMNMVFGIEKAYQILIKLKILFQ